MQPNDFTDQKFGNLVKDPTGYWSFSPNPLPPRLELTWGLAGRLSEADRALSELAGVARNLPNPRLLIGPFARREAVLSSRIEGTQASLSDLFFFEAADSVVRVGDRVPPEDVREVAKYVRAMEYGRRRLRELPISLRFIREIHGKLMEGVRGQHLTPGEFRRSQNWIGPPGCTLMDATHVPPRVPEMMQCLDAFEKFLHAESPFPALVRMALIHYQFEAIHPFLDGNGRVGRLLISLLLCHDGLLSEPLLYLSAYFERQRHEYYRLLLTVSRTGDWPRWIEFFLTGVAEQSQDAIRRTARLLELWKTYRRTFESARSSALLLTLVDDLFECPVLSVPKAAKRLKVTQRSASLNIMKLVNAGILVEATGRERHRLFVCRGIIDAIEAQESA